MHTAGAQRMYSHTHTRARLDACVHQPVKQVHQFETQELTYLLVCCGAHKGRRTLSPTGTHTHTDTHTGLMTEARSNCVFLTGP